MDTHTKVYKLTPSSMTFLWEGCKHCWYMQVKHGVRQPSIPLPSVFTEIDGQMKQQFIGMKTTDISPKLRPGVVRPGEYLVSAAFSYEGIEASACIVGKTDCVVEFEDGTWGVLDWKTASKRPRSWDAYTPQLSAYAHCMEAPDIDRNIRNGGDGLGREVSAVGLVVFSPDRYRTVAEDRALLAGHQTFWPLEMDRPKFAELMRQMLTLLAEEKSPKSDPDCSWCTYRADNRFAGARVPLTV